MTTSADGTGRKQDAVSNKVVGGGSMREFETESTGVKSSKTVENNDGIFVIDDEERGQCGASR